MEAEYQADTADDGADPRHDGSARRSQRASSKIRKTPLYSQKCEEMHVVR